MTETVKEKIKIAIAFLLLMMILIVLVNGNQKYEQKITQIKVERNEN